MSECQLRARVRAFMQRQEDEACHFDAAESECERQSYLQGLQAGVADALRTSADGLSELLDICTRCACSGGTEKPVEAGQRPQAGAKPSPGFAPSPTERARFLLARSDAHEARPVNRHSRVFLAEHGHRLDRRAFLCARNLRQQGAFSICKRVTSPVDICRCTPNQCTHFQCPELPVDRNGADRSTERAPTTTSHQYCSPEQTDSQLREHPERVSGHGRQPMNITDEKAVKVEVDRGLAFEADGASPPDSAAKEGLRKPPLDNGVSGPESGSTGEGGGSDCAAEQVIRDGSLWRALLQVLRRAEHWSKRKSPEQQTEAVHDLRAAVKQAEAIAGTLHTEDGVPLVGLWAAAHRCSAHFAARGCLQLQDVVVSTATECEGETDPAVREGRAVVDRAQHDFLEHVARELARFGVNEGESVPARFDRFVAEYIATGVERAEAIDRADELEDAPTKWRERCEALEQKLRDSEEARAHLQGLECEARKRAVTIEAQRRTAADQLEQLVDVQAAWVERLSALPLMGGNPELRFNELVATAEYIDAECIRRGAYASGIRGRFDQLVEQFEQRGERLSRFEAELRSQGQDDPREQAVAECEQVRRELVTEWGHEPTDGLAFTVRALAREHKVSRELAERVGAQVEAVVCALKRAGAEDLESVGAAVDRLAADRDAWKQDARSARRELLSIGRGSAPEAPAPEAPPTEPAPQPAPSDLRDQYVCEGCRLILRAAGYYVSQVSEAFGEGEAQHCARCGDYLDSSLGAYVGFKVLRDPVELEHVRAAGLSSEALERLIRETSLQAAREVMQGAPEARITELEVANRQLLAERDRLEADNAELQLAKNVAESELDGMNKECAHLAQERDDYQQLYRKANESAGAILRMGMPETETEVFGAVLPLWRDLCQLARRRHGEPLPEGIFELRLGEWLMTTTVRPATNSTRLEYEGGSRYVYLTPGRWFCECRAPGRADVELWVEPFGVVGAYGEWIFDAEERTQELRGLVHVALTDSREPAPLPPEVKP